MKLRLCSTLCCLALLLLSACPDSTGTSSADMDAGGDGPPTDAPFADSPRTDAPSCSGDAAVVSCCCQGDVQAIPICEGDGALSCAAGLGLYHGADCSCTNGHGPCCGAVNMLDASDAADAPPPEGSTCAPPQVLRYETAGCGAAAHPVCSPAARDASVALDACVGEVCGCNGTTLTQCDYPTTSWSHLGPCADGGEGGTDAADQ